MRFACGIWCGWLIGLSGWGGAGHEFQDNYVASFKRIMSQWAIERGKTHLKG